MRIRSWKVIMVQGLRRSVESHATACQKWHPATLRRGFHATACQRSLGSSDTRPFSTRNHPGTTLVHRRQYPPNLDHMICHKHGTKTILQSIPIHPKSRNKPTSISIHIFLVSIHKTKTTNQRGKNPIPRCKSNNSTHIPYKTKDPYKFHSRIHTKLQRSIQVLLITFLCSCSCFMPISYGLSYTWSKPKNRALHVMVHLLPILVHVFEFFPEYGLFCTFSIF